MAVTLNSGVEQSTDNTTNNPRDVVGNVFELEPDAHHDALCVGGVQCYSLGYDG
jgi:hypothetical protein